MWWRRSRDREATEASRQENLTISGVIDSAVAIGTGNTILRTSTAPTGAIARDEAPTNLKSNSAGQPSQEGNPASAVRLCLAADIERYSRYRAPEAMRAQQRLLDVLARARHRAGIDETRVETQASGDGQFAILPTGLDESEVIPALVRELEIALAEVNSDLNNNARLRIRAALHRGFIQRGPNGWTGDSAIGVHRILDSAPVRTALADNQAVDFALAVPDALYRDVIGHGYGPLRPETFTAARVEIPAKEFTDRVWIYVPVVR